MKNRRLRADRGVTLIVILLMMLALAFLGLGAMNSSVLQEHMAGNERDRNVATQAAEAALRDAAADIEANLGTTGFSYGCANGLCLPPSMPASGAQSAPVWTTLNWAADARTYGSATGAPALVGPDNIALAAQPQYIIELLPQLDPGNGSGNSACSTCAPSLTGQPYRITVRAFGARSSTVVILQSTYIKQ
ncbi:MAG: pilus assembly protein [Burkholderiales bacterium]|nr:pilus assembly protein PilX [Burkholderiales bacterium]MDE1926858.1 pilus assembly protein [Burkholderiales bacterium]MDE2159500.1 pilus assembly protein [Burkholderiales bacterium]MDE2503702.1 pilus assembly protein [Burkholderiales bacterium]